MNFPTEYPAWMWAYFAVLGSLAILFVTLTFWAWLKTTRLTSGLLKRALRWQVGGYASLFAAVWFACGIGGPPGNLLSPEINFHNTEAATGAALAGMLFSVIGWVLLWIAMRLLLKHAQAMQR
jgi:hypothetical protein